MLCYLIATAQCAPMAMGLQAENEINQSKKTHTHNRRGVDPTSSRSASRLGGPVPSDSKAIRRTKIDAQRPSGAEYGYTPMRGHDSQQPPVVGTQRTGGATCDGGRVLLVHRRSQLSWQSGPGDNRALKLLGMYPTTNGNRQRYLSHTSYFDMSQPENQNPLSWNGEGKRVLGSVGYKAPDTGSLTARITDGQVKNSLRWGLPEIQLHQAP